MQNWRILLAIDIFLKIFTTDFIIKIFFENFIYLDIVHCSAYNYWYFTTKREYLQGVGRRLDAWRGFKSLLPDHLPSCNPLINSDRRPDHVHHNEKEDRAEINRLNDPPYRRRVLPAGWILGLVFRRIIREHARRDGCCLH